MPGSISDSYEMTDHEDGDAPCDECERCGGFGKVPCDDVTDATCARCGGSGEEPLRFAAPTK